MKTGKSLLVLGILSTFSLSAFAQNRPYYDIDNDRYSRDDLRHDFRDANIRRDMRDYSRHIDICQDVKENLVMAQNAYVAESNMSSTLNSEVSSLQSQVNSKRNRLSSLRRSLDNANAEVRRLADLNIRKPELMNFHASNIDSLNREIPKKESLLKRQKEKKDKECKGLTGWMRRSCKNAKKAVKQTENELNTMISSRNDSTSMINVLNNLDTAMANATREANKAEAKLTREQTAVPTLATLEASLNSATSRRNAQGPALAQARTIYGQTAIRAEKCQIMKFEARKSRVFKQAIVDLAANNGAKCATAMDRIRRIRGYAAKEAMMEAYQMVCNSDVLVRTVVVPAGE